MGQRLTSGLFIITLIFSSSRTLTEGLHTLSSVKPRFKPPTSRSRQSIHIPETLVLSSKPSGSSHTVAGHMKDRKWPLLTAVIYCGLSHGVGEVGNTKTQSLYVQSCHHLKTQSYNIDSFMSSLRFYVCSLSLSCLMTPCLSEDSLCHIHVCNSPNQTSNHRWNDQSAWWLQMATLIFIVGLCGYVGSL